MTSSAEGECYKVKSAAKLTSNEARSGLVLWGCDAAFVSLREGAAFSWLVSSRKWEKKKRGRKKNMNLW